MTHIAPLPHDAITDPEMRDLIAQGEALGVPDDLFPRILARAPALAKPMMRALLMSHARGKFFASLRSRKALAAGLTEKRIDEGCFEYEDAAKGFSEAEKIALRFADLMYLDAGQIDKAFYDDMKKHWSEAQIMELGSFMVCHYGMAMFMRSLGAKASR
jgi:hypothetical protein